jgi:hypothetical protein
MSLTVFFIFLFVAVVVIAVSVMFIRNQLMANKTRKDKLLAGEERYLHERQKRIDSINILLKVVDNNEINWIEASIRIKNLLDQLGIDLSGHDDVSAFYIVTERTEHIPSHEQWKDLPGDAKVKFRNEMDACEKEYSEHLNRAKLVLMSYEW